ncbi:HesB/IscA family protein [Planctomicrobium sp. SH664]|uniref:HesB/IscA family protein n=1 Tax=Planctomicrobium sp. SH664 TaxID=3448125 RepID=UPI003F5C0A87
MIQLTEKAANEVKRVLAEQNHPETTYLRVGVVGGGCSGFQYQFAFDEAADTEKDHISEQYGVKIAVQKNHDLHLDGTTIDYYDGLERRGFQFNNPNVIKSCGCGSSFSA